MYQRQHAKRNRDCDCCGQRRIREHRRVGKPGDPDYAIAVCPNCDAAPPAKRDGA